LSNTEFDERIKRMKMKSAFLPVVVAMLVACCVQAATNSASLVEIKAADFGNTNSTVKIVELERNAKTSKLKLTYGPMGSSVVGSSMFIMRGFYEVAKARGTEYFTNLKEWDDPDGGRLYIGGFTNKKDADILTEFGEEFSLTNEYGQTRMFMSVSQCKMLWGDTKK
jgi:hypothetical protein